VLISAELQRGKDRAETPGKMILLYSGGRDKVAEKRHGFGVKQMGQAIRSYARGKDGKRRFGRWPEWGKV